MRLAARNKYEKDIKKLEQAVSCRNSSIANLGLFFSLKKKKAFYSCKLGRVFGSEGKGKNDEEGGGGR